MSEYLFAADKVPSASPIETRDTSETERTIMMAICTEGVKPPTPIVWLRIVADKVTGEIRCAIQKAPVKPK